MYDEDMSGRGTLVENQIEDQRRLVGFDGSIEVSYEWVEGKLVDTWRRGVSFGSCF